MMLLGVKISAPGSQWRDKLRHRRRQASLDIAWQQRSVLGLIARPWDSQKIGHWVIAQAAQ